MNRPPTPPKTWPGLLAQAQADAPPAIDEVALREVYFQAWRERRRDHPNPSQTWAGALAAWDPRRVAFWCGGGLAACALVVDWSVRQGWSDLAWAAFTGVGLGGAL